MTRVQNPPKPNFSEQPPVNQKQEGSSKKSQKNEWSLRRRLLLGVIPTVVIPLVVAGASGWWIIHKNIETQYRDRLQKQSLLAGEAMNQVLFNLQQISEAIANNPLVMRTVRQASNQVEAQGLNRISPERVEQRFAETKLLDSDPILNNYLKQVASPKRITEILITEKYGFNVAYNQVTSDFIQNDETWWQEGKNRGQWLGDLQFNESTGRKQVDSVHLITEPDTGKFLGVIKMGIPASAFKAVETYLEYASILETGEVQVLEPATGEVLVTVTSQGTIERNETKGGEAVQQVARAMVDALPTRGTDLAEQVDKISQEYNLRATVVEPYIHRAGDRSLRVSFFYGGRNYEMTTVPQTDWVAISSIDHQVLQSAGSELIVIFTLVAVVLAGVAVGVVFLLARQFSSPLVYVSRSAEKAAAGNLSVRVAPQGSMETRTLAKSFNNLVERLQQLLQEQATTAEQQLQEREKLEKEISQLTIDVEDAADGDLTVRSRVLEGEIGIVADLLNELVENLQETAQQVKTAANRVSDSLGENEMAIREVAEGAIAEAEEIQSTLRSVEAMNRSIQEVADNAQKAASIADTAFTTAQQGNQAMDETVESIQELRSTVEETSKTMKHLEKSAQKISQVVSLIDEISLKTTLLAMNASVEANRAGEFGQGFTAVAEQIESLSEQSALAAQEIAQIVSEIQSETQQATETMEQGTTAVIASSCSVEETKARLADVVARSEEINTLMQSISNSTVSQAKTSQAVSRLMEQVSHASQDRSQTSGEVAEAIQETVQIAKALEASVKQFRVK